MTEGVHPLVAQAYWQSAIAARPSASYKGYLLGAVLWFCIPFTLATSLGLGCAALDLPVTVSEAAQGLVPPAVAFHLLGSGGAIVLTIMLFMAVTSAGSAELIAVSSIISYDIYRWVSPPHTFLPDRRPLLLSLNPTHPQLVLYQLLCLPSFQMTHTSGTLLALRPR